jgi:two-component system, OmpR family, sensor histidine kinase KdpD
MGPRTREVSSLSDACVPGSNLIDYQHHSDAAKVCRPDRESPGQSRQRAIARSIWRRRIIAFLNSVLMGPLVSLDHMDATAKYQIDGNSAANAGDCMPARDCLLVVIGSSEYDLDLIRAGKRLAEALHAVWAVVNVETSAFRFVPDRDRDRRVEIVQIAESLGAEGVTLHGDSPAKTIAGYARLRRASKILVGSPTQFGWHALTQYARVAALKRRAPGIEILSIAPRASAMRTARVETPLPLRREVLSRTRVRDYLWGLTVTAICTVIAWPVADHFDLINIVMIYLLGAALGGLFLGRGPSALTAVTNILAFDYFFVPPRFSFLVLDPSYVVTFAAMLLVALIIANLMIAVRAQTEAAGAREHHTAALYVIARDLSIARDIDAMVATAVRHIGEILQSYAQVLICDESGQIIAPPLPTSRDQRPKLNLMVAQWVAARRERAGVGTREFPAERARYLPLRGSRTIIGVLAVERADPADALLPEQQRLLEAIADQLALALERARLAELAHAAQLVAERAAIRNTLLASISHDLRTPLSAIAGAGSIVAQSDFVLDLYRRVTLGRLIEDKARDMSDLLTNVLELVRLESGTDVLNRDWHALNELVGLALGRHESRLTGWKVTTELPPDLPLLSLDAGLIVQLLGNLLENAIKYTPPGTHIQISAQCEDDTVRLVVEDTGPGFGLDAPERLFEKFTRGRVESNSGGVGLGLAICRAVARLHGGDIWAAASPMGGARFEVTIPLVEDTATVETPPSIA